MQKHLNKIHLDVKTKQGRAYVSGSHVDECIAHIAAILKVDGEVEEVIFSVKSLRINCLHQNFLRVLVWNVPNHQCGP